MIKGKVTGGLLKKLEAFSGRGIKNLTRLTVVALADTTMNEVKSQTPVFTGRLRQSWSALPSRLHAGMRLGRLRKAGRVPSASWIAASLSRGKSESNYHPRFGHSKSVIRVESRTPYLDAIESDYGYHKKAVLKGMRLTKKKLPQIVLASFRKAGWR